MSTLFWIIAGAIVVANALFVKYVFAPWLRRNMYVKEKVVDPDRLPPCKETCDIHGKIGDPIRYECGHDDAPEFKLDLWGEPKLHKRPGVTPMFCSDCALKEILAVSTRCGDCGFAIMPGEPVAVRSPDRGDGVTGYPMNPEGGVIVCVRLCDHAPGFCGHWTGKGVKPYFPDRGNAISQAFTTGEPAFVQIAPLDSGKKDA